MKGKQELLENIYHAQDLLSVTIISAFLETCLGISHFLVNGWNVELWNRFKLKRQQEYPITFPLAATEKIMVVTLNFDVAIVVETIASFGTFTVIV